MTNLTEVRGVIFKSQREAAKHFGISSAAISAALAQGNPDRIGLGRKANNAKPVEYEGVSYPSIAEMGRALGIRPCKARRWLRSKSPE